MPENPIPITRPSLPPLEQYVALLEEIWTSRMLSNFSTFATRLEELATTYLDAPHVLSVASGDIGLIITLAALRLPPGAPCYLPDFTFNSTINAALWAQLTPVIVDIDPDTLNLDALALDDAMRRRREPGVVLATHVFGNPCDVSGLEAVARDHDAYLVFDAAHAYGSRRDGVPVGNFGDAEVFSLSGTKLVTSAEGGLIATPHDWVAERLRYLRAYGFQNDYRSRYVGLNGKMSELHCALGTLTLADAERQVKHRHEIVDEYRSRLGDDVGWQRVRASDRSTYKDVAVLLGTARQAVEDALREHQVQTKRYFVPLHLMGPYAEYAEGELPRATALHESVLCLPAFAQLSESDISMVTGTILAEVDRS